MILDNRTRWRAADVERLLLLACADPVPRRYPYQTPRAISRAPIVEPYVPPSDAVVRLVHPGGDGDVRDDRSPSMRFYGRALPYTAFATLGGGNSTHPEEEAVAMLVRLPTIDEGMQIGRLAWLLRHEVWHWRGLLHEDMPGSIYAWTRLTRGPRFAAGLSVEVVDAVDAEGGGSP